MPDPKKITIHEIELSVPQPYAEGHQLTAIEARQLNQVFAENIANNQRSALKKAKDGGEGAPKLEDAIAAFNKHAGEYAFTGASAGGSRITLSPVEREARKLATAVVLSKLKKTNRKRADVTKEAFEAEVARFAESDKIKKLAAKNVKEMESLKDLELDTAA